MKLGFDCLREVMVAGYRPSFARLYDAPDAQQHFSSWLEEDKAILIWMAEGPANITKAIEEGIKEMMYKHPELEEVDPKLIEKWYSGLKLGTRTDCTGKRRNQSYTQYRYHNRGIRKLG